MKEYRLTDWLPTTRKEVELRGWDELDVILFSGDAYVDHPSFGAASSGASSKRKVCVWRLYPNPTGEMTYGISRNWDVPVSSSVSVQAVWTAWSTNTLPTNVCAAMMPILPTHVRTCVPNILRLSIPKY